MVRSILAMVVLGVVACGGANAQGGNAQAVNGGNATGGNAVANGGSPAANDLNGNAVPLAPGSTANAGGGSVDGGK